MKKAVSCVICAVLLALTLCACSGGDALGLVIVLNCDSADSIWQLEMTKQGVVDTVGDGAEKDPSTGDMSFVFEAVGEGETELDFYYIKVGSADTSKATRVRKYSISVNADFEITSKLISDEEITVPAVKINDKKEAQELLEEKLGVLDKKDGNEYVIKYKGSYTEDGIKWYKFSLSEVVTLKDGKTVLRFKQMYAVSENGEIKTLDEGRDTPDEPLNLK